MTVERPHLIWRGTRMIGSRWDPWNRGPFDRVLWQVKWENVFLRMLCRVAESGSYAR